MERRVSSTKAMRLHNKFAKCTVSKQTIAASSVCDEKKNEMGEVLGAMGA